MDFRSVMIEYDTCAIIGFIQIPSSMLSVPLRKRNLIPEFFFFFCTPIFSSVFVFNAELL